MDIIVADCARCGRPAEWDDASQDPAICRVCWDAGQSKGGVSALGRQHRLQILELHNQGLVIEAIVRETGLARRTVYRHLEGVNQRRADRARRFNGTVVKAAPPGRAPHGSVERSPVARLSGRTSPGKSRHLDVPGGLPPAGAPTQAGERHGYMGPVAARPPIAAKKKASVEALAQ